MSGQHYVVTYCGDFFMLRTTVDAASDEQAIEEADKLMLRHYGMDMKALANDVEAEVEG